MLTPNSILTTKVVRHTIIELLFVFVEAVFVAPKSEELGIAT